MIGLAQLLKLPTAQIDAALNQFSSQLRVCTVATVISFDEDAQTVSVQPNQQEIMIPGLDAEPEAETIEPLSDVPIWMPRGGGYSLTFPITAGDECLVIFADSCLDAWLQQGGTQPQMDKRRHDLSDAIALFGIWNQTRRLSAYSTSGASLRSDDGSVSITLSEGTVTVQGATINVSAQTANVTGTEKVVINGNGQTVIEGGAYLEHTHSGVMAGGGVSGPVVSGS